jgi:hypothetical protein
MTVDRATAADWEALDALIEAYLQSIGNPDYHYLHEMIDNEPGEAVSNMLCLDALGEFLLADHQVDHLWQLGFEIGYSPQELIPDDILAKARPERRTRPSPPIRYPLKGGGHGTGRGIPGKSEYPARWSDDDAMDLVMDVAQQPEAVAPQPDGTFRARGVRDGVELGVIVTELGQVVTAYPVAGEGVVTNVLDDVRSPYVERLQRLVDRTSLDEEQRHGIDELMQVGEWDQVIQQLRALPTPDADELEQLASAAGLTTPG